MYFRREQWLSKASSIFLAQKNKYSTNPKEECDYVKGYGFQSFKELGDNYDEHLEYCNTASRKSWSKLLAQVKKSGNDSS